MAIYPRTTGTLGTSGSGGLYYAADGKVTYDPKTGRKYENKIKIHRGERSSWEDYLIGIGAEYELDPIGNTTLFWVTWRTPESNDTEGIPSGVIKLELTTTWSIEPIELSRDVWELPEIIRQLSTCTPNQSAEPNSRTDVKLFLKGMIDALLRGLSTYPDPANPNDTLDISASMIVQQAVGFGMDQTTWEGFIDTLAHNTTSWLQSSWSLKRRMVLPSNSSVLADLENVNRLFTPSGLLTDLQAQSGIPSTVRFALPTNGYWLKKAPSISQNTSGSWEINGEWWWAEQYLPFIYGTPIKS